MQHISRRGILVGTAALTLARPAIAQGAPIKIGLMLPFSGTFAALGENIAAAFEMYLQERDSRLGGRAVTVIRLDDESDPAKAPQNVNRLLDRDHAEVLIGTVHSGVVMALVQAAREREVPLIIPNAGNVAATRELCAPSIFRSSFSNWQPAYGMGKALAAKGAKKAAWVTWDYAAGKESGEGFRDGLRAGGGDMTHLLTLAFPDTNFMPMLGVLSGLGVDAVGSFFAGGGAVQFVKDYAAAGLREKLPLCGSGFLTEGVLAAQGAAAEGIQTALPTATDWTTQRTPRFVPPSGKRPGATRMSMRCRATMRARCLRSGWMRQRATQRRSRRWRRQSWLRRSTARAAHSPCRRRITRFRRSICARQKAARTA